ncbi:MAG: aryl-sulfate sulfotransferase, partial [Candidatus Kapaibacterium sp.]
MALHRSAVIVAISTTRLLPVAATLTQKHMKQISASCSVFVLFVVLLITTNPLLSQPASKTYKIAQKGSASPGYFMISPARSDTLGVIDNYGRTVFPLNVGMQINLSSYNNRELTYFGVTNSAGVLGLACYVRVNAKRQITDSIFPVGPYQADFHEGFATSDTTFLILGTYRVKTDLSKYVAGGFPDAEIIGNIIQEVTRSGRVVFEWKSLDHIPYSDATEDIDFTQVLVDVMHINSIFRDSDGGLIISCRHLDEVIKIDGKTGQIVWRLGGSKSKNNQFQFLNDTTSEFFGFSHQHCVSRTPTGNLLMFDNGNLKPEPQSSRVVEYEINEKEKTVRKVFEYSPSSKVFASTMGSVSALSNGNMLVGYGAAVSLTGKPSDIAAEEIDRSGNVVATVDNLPLPRINAYRIRKTTYGMTGVQKTVNSVGSTTFSEADSTTLISLQASAARKPTIVTVERHHYAPQNVTFTAPVTLSFPPVRWGVRLDDTSALTGTMKLRLGKVQEVEDPGSVKVLYRSIEGTGPFSLIAATYTGTDSSWTIPFIRQGEYAVAYTSRLRPELIAPLNNSVDVDVRPQLRWNKLLFASSYQVQIARDSAFTIDVESRTVTDTVFTPAALRNNTVFWWRMRKVSGQGSGPWSAHWRFSTKFNRPSILEPATDTQAVFVNAESVFRWTGIKGASRYRIIVTDSAAQTVLDTTQSDTVCRIVHLLPMDAKLAWNVRAVIDSVEGRESGTCFITTAPKQPSLIAPEPNVYLPNTSKTQVSWSAAYGVTRYNITVTVLPESKRIVDTVLPAVTSFMVEGLEPRKRYRWTCVSIGTYGPSLPSVREFTIAERSTLAKPNISGSLQRNGIPISVSAECSWL